MTVIKNLVIMNLFWDEPSAFPLQGTQSSIMLNNVSKM